MENFSTVLKDYFTSSSFWNKVKWIPYCFVATWMPTKHRIYLWIYLLSLLDEISVESRPKIIKFPCYQNIYADYTYEKTGLFL